MLKFGVTRDRFNKRSFYKENIFVGIISMKRDSLEFIELIPICDKERFKYI